MFAGLSMCTLMVGVATCVCSTCDCWTCVLMGMLGMWCCCCCRSPPAPNWCIGPRGRSARGRAWCSAHLVDDLQDVVATLCLLLGWDLLMGRWSKPSPPLHSLQFQMTHHHVEGFAFLYAFELPKLKAGPTTEKSPQLVSASEHRSRLPHHFSVS